MTGQYRTKYEILKADLIRRIESGKYKPGGRFPSQNQLMRSEKVSYSTVSRVLQELQEEHYISRIKGKGSYVNEFSERVDDLEDSFKIKFIISQEFRSYMSGAKSWMNNFEITSSVIQEAAKKGIEIERIYYNDNSSLPDDITEDNSFVFLLNYFGYNKPVIEALKEQAVPFVIHGPMDSVNYNYSAVVANVWQGAYDVTNHLLNQGRKDILFIMPEPSGSWSIPKFAGYLKAMKNAGLDVPCVPGLTVGYELENVQVVIKEWLDNNMSKLPQAVIAFNDETAVAAMNVFRNKGINIPDDIAIVGFDDNPECVNCEIPLTTVKYPCEEIGVSSVQLMSLLHEQPHLSPIVKTIPTEIIFRESFQL